MTADVEQGPERFTVGLVIDVARVLEAHGYGPFEEGRQFVELQQHLFHLLHGQPDWRCTGGVAAPMPASVAAGAAPPADAESGDGLAPSDVGSDIDAALVEHGELLARRIEALRDAEVATEAALARFDDQQAQHQASARRRRRNDARRRSG